MSEHSNKREPRVIKQHPCSPLMAMRVLVFACVLRFTMAFLAAAPQQKIYSARFVAPQYQSRSLETCSLGHALRSLVCCEGEKGVGAQTPESLVKLFESTSSTPRLPSCLDLKDRETRVRLAQLLRHCTALELLQQQFTDSVIDLHIRTRTDSHISFQETVNSASYFFLRVNSARCIR